MSSSKSRLASVAYADQKTWSIRLYAPPGAHGHSKLYVSLDARRERLGRIGISGIGVAEDSDAERNHIGISPSRLHSPVWSDYSKPFKTLPKCGFAGPDLWHFGERRYETLRASA